MAMMGGSLRPCALHTGLPSWFETRACGALLAMRDMNAGRLAPVIARSVSDEATSLHEELDCFASLAMTGVFISSSG
jgi:hypothetical protein